MKIGLIYGTNRPNMATTEIVGWLESSLKQKGFTVEVGLNEEFENFDCDAYIVGSPVYAFRVWKPFISYIKKNKKYLQEKPTAMFVVCGIGKLKGLYLRSIRKSMSLDPISKMAFKGYGDLQKKGDFDTLQKVRVDEWVEELENLFKK